MSFSRRLKKLKKMSGREIGSRLSDAARRWQDEYAWRVRHVANPRPRAAQIASRLASQAARLIPGAARDQFAALESADPDLHRRLATEGLSRAQCLLAGKCELLGFAADISGTVDWHSDPRSGHRWPREFYAGLDLYELPDGIDVKYVWELNRHQFLVELAQGWSVSGDDRFAHRVRELILDWIAHNPVFEGVNWTSALEAAMRGISWLWALASLSQWPGWRDEDWRRIAESLVDHARYLSQHLSFYSSPYNHLIGEAAGLFILGAWLEGFPAAAGWRRRGGRVLVEHGPRQFYDDGFCVEQATGYHFYTLGFLAHALATSRRMGEPLDSLEQVVARAFSAGSAFQQPDGLWPAIGDVDSARALPVVPENFWDFRGLYSLGSVLCNRPDLAPVADGAGPELFWLEGVAGVERFLEIGPALPNEMAVRGDPAPGVGAKNCRLEVLPDSGYCVVRSGEGASADWLLFDCGPMAHGLFADDTPSTAHGHADPLQVLFHLEGQPILIDPGMPFYFGPREWVDYFRGAAAHNTVEIVDLPVARHAGRLGWSHVCHSLRMAVRDDEEGFTVSGVVNLQACGAGGSGTSITRSARLVAGAGLWIADLIDTDRPREVRWAWQLPSRSAAASGGLESGIRRGAATLIQWCNSGALPMREQAGAQTDPQGWHAPGYGRLVPGTKLESRATITQPALFVTYIGLGMPGAHIRCGEHEVLCTRKDEVLRTGRNADEQLPSLDLTPPRPLHTS